MSTPSLPCFRRRSHFRCAAILAAGLITGWLNRMNGGSDPYLNRPGYNSSGVMTPGLPPCYTYRAGDTRAYGRDSRSITDIGISYNRFGRSSEVFSFRYSNGVYGRSTVQL